MAPVAPPKRKFREIEHPESDGKPMAESPIHQELMIHSIVALRHHYAHDPMVHVVGNNFLYYEEGNPRKCVSPNIYVVYGVRHWLRPVYKVWEERGITPSVVIELTSKSTQKEDNTTKFDLYEQTLHVDEYLRFDPTGDYLRPRLQGLRLEQGRYSPMPMENGDRIYSRNLGLYLVMTGEKFRFYDPRTQDYLKSPEETFAAYEEEQRLRQSTEEEVAQLRAELERLKKSGT